MDPELEDDLVGVTSARLLAAGVPRGERLRALRLLGVLLTVADRERRVRRPLADLAREFDLPGDEVEGWLDHLAAVGAVTAEEGTLVLAGDEGTAGSGLRLQDFLDAAAELDEPRPAAPVRRLALLRPAGAALAAAALLVAVLVAPRIVEDDPAPASSERDATTTVATSTLAPGTTSPTVAPTEPPPPAPEQEGQEGPVLVPTTSSTLLPCPNGIPTIEVLSTTNGADGLLAVDGIARNPSAEELAVESFTLRATIAGQDITVPGLQRPLVVPAGSSVLWQARLPVAAPAGTLVRVTLGEWEWRGVPLGCPSP